VGLAQRGTPNPGFLIPHNDVVTDNFFTQSTEVTLDGLDDERIHRSPRNSECAQEHGSRSQRIGSCFSRLLNAHSNASLSAASLLQRDDALA
jgi:hypothetical protein